MCMICIGFISKPLVFTEYNFLVLLVSHLTSRASTQGHRLPSAYPQHSGEQDPWILGVPLAMPLLPSCTSCHRTNSPTPSCYTITSHQTDRYPKVSMHHILAILSQSCWPVCGPAVFDTSLGLYDQTVVNHLALRSRISLKLYISHFVAF